MNDTFLRACRGEQTPYTPIWLMRQAGRYLPEYRELRAKHRMLEMCRTPELATEVTLMPLRRFPLDAAILFSDITMPFFGMQIPFEIQEKVGPVIARPVRNQADISQLPVFDVEEELPFVLEAIRMLRRELDVPLIGFAGAPFTMAAYLIEGRPSRDFPRARALMYSDPEAWSQLMRVLAENTLNYLKAQINAGAQAVQIFDSWVGGLHPETYRRFLMPHMRFIFEGLREFAVPTIHFGTGTASLLPLMHEAGGDVIGIDWKTPIESARSVLGPEIPLQGNLDPVSLNVSFATVKELAAGILDAFQDHSGHIFNLGHGIMPEAKPANVEQLVNFVHEYSQKKV